ncbi:MAG: MBL fold metallo-hydrolase [Thermomicrobiales bacterium]|nr:MBL fold metallo-hydrolase [Thermomicrobiales bacterium]
MSLEQQIKDLNVDKGSVAIVWLGQAGYALKTSAGTIVMIDPYLTDWGETQWGLVRILPPAIDPAELQPDLLLISHWHEDHLDVPLVKQWSAAGATGIFAGPITCAQRAPVWGWPTEQVVQIDSGERRTIGEIDVLATFARHETPQAPAPEAVGYLLEIDGLKIWDVADTEYDARLRPMADENIDVMIVPINGVGGNLTTHEAALLTWYVKPKIVIPMHYNMWTPEGFGPGATLDPLEFAATFAKLGGTSEVRILDVGEIAVFSK